MLPLLLVSATSARTAASPVRGVAPSVVTLNLDDPPDQRWTHIAPSFRQYMPAVQDYLESSIPKWAVPLVEAVGGLLVPYFGAEAAAEMTSLAGLLGVTKGEILILNILMQVESLGLNCSNWNSTGPTRKDDPGCKAVDPSQSWCYCKDASDAGALSSGRTAQLLASRRGDGPGLCTSVIAQTSDGRMLHARNLDWNLPPPVLPLLVDIVYTRGGKQVARGTGAAGFIGIFNAMVPGGYSVTIDARGKGGMLLDNLLQALLHKSLTPSMLLRRTATSAATYTEAVAALSSTPLVDENYYIIAGASTGEGAVIARGREKAVDVWPLNSSEPDGWFRLQTNYDHWEPVPLADNRRGPGVAAMKALGPAAVSLAAMWGVITSPPVFNGHTDYSGLFEPAVGTYNSTVWM